MLGALRGAYGLKGWVRVQPFQDGRALLQSKNWYLMSREGDVRPLKVEQSKAHGNGLIAKFAEINNPEDADALKGAVGLLREDFPSLNDGEFYWVDLIGCRVVNGKGEELGIVKAMDSNGVQDILDVRNDSRRYLIPFVETYILNTDVDQKILTVDWELDWD